MREFKINKYKDNCFYYFKEVRVNKLIFFKLIYLSNVILIIILVGFVEEFEYLY